ncbi:MAG: 50S ribosomal protein L6 [Candidatus Wallbacteria bacterium]
MSRIGKKPIVVPKGVEVKINGHHVSVKGPLGTLANDFHPHIDVAMEKDHVIVKRHSDAPAERSLHGLTRALINNMITGVTKGFEKVLEISGTGYKGKLEGKKLVLNVGYTHPVEFTAPEGIKFEIEKETVIKIKGIDRGLVGQTAANVRGAKEPEPYKGKGIKYSNEVVQRKVGKRGK